MPAQQIDVIGKAQFAGAVILKGATGDVVPSSGYYAFQVVNGIAVIEDSSGGAVSLSEPLASKPMNVLQPGDYIDLNTSGIDNNGNPAAGDLRLGVNSNGAFALIDSTGAAIPLTAGKGGTFIPNLSVSSTAATPYMEFYRENGTAGSPTKVVSGNVVAQFSVAGVTAGGVVLAKNFFQAEAAGDWDGTTDVPLRLIFRTIPDASGTATTRMIIDHDGTIYAGSAVGEGALDRIIANNQTGTTYTLAATDRNKIVELNNASAIALTIPTNASVPIPVGFVCGVYQQGAGQITASGAGTTIRAPSGAKTRAQYTLMSLWKRATDEWVISGEVTT